MLDVALDEVLDEVLELVSELVLELVPVNFPALLVSGYWMELVLELVSAQ